MQKDLWHKKICITKFSDKDGTTTSNKSSATGMSCHRSCHRTSIFTLKKHSNTAVLKYSYSEIFHKYHKEKPVTVYFSGKVATLLKRTMPQIQKQLSMGVFKKMCSENMQQIYRRTLMPKYDFNKVAKQFYRNHTLAWVFSCKFATYFQNTFS